MAAKVADPVVLIVDGDEEDVWLRRVGKRRAGRGEKECDEGE
jgi:bifunctional DNA-binding transcriptional regulator/antitoxin component of YhaV-PrlF toxin-antitoxin module